MKQLKELPKFKNEDEEREFWATHSFLDYYDVSQFQRFPFRDLRQKAMQLKFDAASIAQFHSQEVMISKSAMGNETFIKEQLNLENLASQIEKDAEAYYYEVSKLENHIGS